MIQSLIVIFAFVFGVKTSEVHDDKYSLSTSGSPEYVAGLEEAQTKCGNSWILEIYDENVATLLTRLNVNFHQNGILLGMKRNTNNWMWSDGTEFSGDIRDQQDLSRVMVYITNDNNNIKYSAATVTDYAAAICSKNTTKGNCTGWFHNGLCYFKPNLFYNTWFKAHNECIRHGATLAIFDNSERNFNMTFIDDRLYWVSLSRHTWMWTHSGKALTFNKWTLRYPSMYQDYYSSCGISDASGYQWQWIYCSGTFHIICMNERNQSKYEPGYNSHSTTPTKAVIDNPNNKNLELNTQSSLPISGISVITEASTNPTSEDSLSSGAKAGIGVGVSLLVVLIVLIGVLVFKYFYQLKMKSGRENSKKPLKSEKLCRNHVRKL